jgi:NADH-quinone oxidoreductase subunit J
VSSVLAQAAQAGSPSTAEAVIFILIGALALGSAISMVMMRNPVHAALMLVLNFFAIAVLYAVLEAQFLATVQIIVYAGAIMVLFLFVIMLLGVGRENPVQRDHVRGLKASGVVLGVVLFAALAVGVGGPYLARSAACPSPSPTEGAVASVRCAGLQAANQAGNVGSLGSLLFTKYVWPFEVISILLVIAAVGAMVLGRREEDPDDLIDLGAATAQPPPAPTDDSEPPPEAQPATIGQGNPAPSGPLQEEK